MNTQNKIITLPQDGFSRESQLLKFLPFGKTTLWQWSKDGRFPKSIKLSPKITVWSNAEVHQWFKSINQKENNNEK